MSPDAKAPPGTCDCHFHVFGPFARFPLDPGRAYDPPEASVEAYQAVAGRLGIERMVVVQPSPYGTDNRVTLAAVRRFGEERARAVAVIDESIDEATLRTLEAGGVRGVRFNLVSGNGTPEAQLDALARRIAPLGWHVQIYAEGEKLAELVPLLARLPVEVVIDHIGGIRAALGTAHPQFQALLRLLDSGRAWVKLCGYRASSAGHPWEDVAPNIQALAKAAPERCVWGTDWPHVHMPPGPRPEPLALLHQLLAWVPDPSARQRILVDNPARLYGF
ncbi:MAG TPA: amidohydrolase family protein [Acetobacteraceae bacterium]|nr:amidohydrolase family protein [Acetobacteraceae bacterium]